MSKRLVNIPRRIIDPYYRYTMPVLEFKIEGNGNGIRCVLLNLEDIAKELHREASDILRYYGFVQGAHVNSNSGRYIINGSYKRDKLESVLDVFIDKYVLCTKCGLPETFAFNDKGKVMHHCFCCSHDTRVEDHSKFYDFFSKELAKRNPQIPDKYKSKSEDTQIITATNTRSSKPKKEITQNPAKSEPKSQESSIEEDREQFKKSLLEDSKPISRKKLISLRKKLGWSVQELTDALVETLIDENALKQVIPFSKRFKEYFGREGNQRPLLDCLVRLVGSKHELLISKFAVILKGFYDLDCLGEDVIVKWFKEETNIGPNEDKIKKDENVVKLVNWLEEEEEDDGEEGKEQKEDN